MSKKIYGIALSVCIGLVSYFLAPAIPIVNAVLVSFFIGVLLSNLISLPNTFTAGIKFSASKLLELSIIFLAFSISFQKIKAIGMSNFAIVAIMVLFLLLLTVVLAKVLKCPTESGWLVGFGTAICGSSAIAALAPSVTKNTENTGIAIAIVNLIGSLGMVAMPFALSYFQVSDANSALFIGAGLHSVGNVAGAGYGMSETIGASALTIKLARVALLSPAIILFNVLIQSGKKKSLSSYFKLPLYLWAFIFITIFVSVVPIPEHILMVLKKIGDILLIISMAAIGLRVSLKQLLVSGQKAMKFGLLIFALQLLIIGLLLMVL